MTETLKRNARNHWSSKTNSNVGGKSVMMRPRKWPAQTPPLELEHDDGVEAPDTKTELLYRARNEQIGEK
jgi:hypothetical protein